MTIPSAALVRAIYGINVQPSELQLERRQRQAERTGRLEFIAECLLERCLSSCRS